MHPRPSLPSSLAARVFEAGWRLLAELVAKLAAEFAADFAASRTPVPMCPGAAVRRRLRIAEALARHLLLILAAGLGPFDASQPRTAQDKPARPCMRARQPGFRLLAAMPRISDRLSAPRIPPRISIAGLDTAPRRGAEPAIARQARLIAARIAVLERVIARPERMAVRLARRLARPGAVGRLLAFQWPRLSPRQAGALAIACAGLPADPEALARELWRAAPPYTNLRG